MYFHLGTQVHTILYLEQLFRRHQGHGRVGNPGGGGKRDWSSVCFGVESLGYFGRWTRVLLARCGISSEAILVLEGGARPSTDQGNDSGEGQGGEPAQCLGDGVSVGDMGG